MFPIYTQFQLCPKGTVVQVSFLVSVLIISLFFQDFCRFTANMGSKQLTKVIRSMAFHLKGQIVFFF